MVQKLRDGMEISMNFELPSKAELPNDFIYPGAFLRIVNLQLINIEPWMIMDKNQVLFRMKGLKERYPSRTLIPFARRIDNDDIAAFEVFKGEKVQIIHDFASSGYEQRGEFILFWDWFKQALHDMINFEINL